MINNKSIFNKILTLSFGGYTSKIIAFSLLPFLTRIYLPSDFGFFAIYIALNTIILTISSLRYDLVIVQVKKEADALTILVISIILNLVISIILYIIIYAYIFIDNDIFNLLKIKKYAYFLPINFFFISCYNILKNWYIRYENYKKISTLEIIQISSISIFQLALGYFSINQGLIFGYFLSSFFLFLIILFELIKILKVGFNFKLKEIFYILKKYFEFPTFSALGAFANQLAQNIPLLFLNKLFLPGIVGMYSLSYKALLFPFTTLNWSVSHIVYKYISTFNNTNLKLAKPFILKLTLALIIFSIPFVIFFFFYGKEIFIFVFGIEWAYSGELSKLIIMIIVIRFCVSPMSRVLLLNKNNFLGMLWQLLYLSTTLLLFIFFSYNSMQDIQFILKLYIVHELVLYLIYYIFIMKKLSP